MKEAYALQQEIIENALFRIDESSRMINSTLARLKEQHIWKKPNASSNSIGNLILHLCGNMHQYIISGLGNSADIRERKKEFSSNPGLSKESLLLMLKENVNKVKQTIESTSIESMLLQREVQGFDLTGVGIIIHVVEHYSYHCGQIAYWTKILIDQDLGFYDGHDLNIKNMPS